MSLALCLVLCLMSWTGAIASCPGDYQSVSYTLWSKVVEACFFVSTDYVRWTDGGDVCGRRNNGSLAEFPSSRKLQAFQNFLSTMPDTTKDELWDAVSEKKKGGPRKKKQGNDNDFAKPIGSEQKRQKKVHQTIHSYVCETDPRETEQTGSSVPQTVARDSSECQAELKRTQEELEKVQVQLLVADCPCSNRSVLEAEAGVKDQRISTLEADNILSQNLTDCRNELGRKEGEVKVLRLALREVLRREKEGISALEGELEKTKEVLRRERVRISAFESELREERRLCGTKDAKISALEEKNSLLEDELEEHSCHCFPGSASLPQEGVMTVTKKELENLAHPQPPSLTIGAWTMQLFMRKESPLFLVVTHCGRVDQDYALTFQVRVNAEKAWTPFSLTYTSEYFDRRRRTSAVYLLSRADVSYIFSAYDDEESFRLEVRLLEAVATDVKGTMDKNEITIKARFANVTAMELWDQVYSEQHFLRLEGFRLFQLRLMAGRRVDSLGLYLSCIGNEEWPYSVSLNLTVTLERDGGKGGPETKSGIADGPTYEERTFYWNGIVLGWDSFVKWDELVAPGSGWIGEDGSLSVSSTVKINL
ncbi:unnamed protein product [Cyprideis torosa]|uniref:Uncharacterized protein n=1 Tax=Cyprideis torosa TaxID=163714 RepID=A0A7R8WNT1_9CRUS|nr:unnamed protein product [Cyprideis torosa]CAG0905028.1 unnamed protein product [Cyprideis torosa]